jgi:hypothetical protein
MLACSYMFAVNRVHANERRRGRAGLAGTRRPTLLVRSHDETMILVKYVRGCLGLGSKRGFGILRTGSRGVTLGRHPHGLAAKRCFMAGHVCTSEILPQTRPEFGGMLADADQVHQTMTPDGPACSHGRRLVSFESRAYRGPPLLSINSRGGGECIYGSRSSPNSLFSGEKLGRRGRLCQHETEL